jgi:hypothetical protein
MCLVQVAYDVLEQRCCLGSCCCQMAICTESRTSFDCAAGARRGILNIPGVEEDVGLIGIHWQGKFIELVPWTSAVSWEIAPWGQWRVSPTMSVEASFICFMYVCV